MGLSSTTNRVTYTGDGSSTIFQFPYYFFGQNDLKVYLYDQASSVAIAQSIGTNYTIGGNVNSQGVYPSGGTVIFTCSVPTSRQVVIYRDPSQVQNYVLNQNGQINSLALVQQLDYLTALTQRLQDEVSRSVRLPDGVGNNPQGTFDPTLPASIVLNSSYGQPFVVNSGATGFQMAVLGQTSGSGFIFTGVLPVANGGTGQGGSLTPFALWYSAGGSSMGQTAAGLMSQVMIAQGSNAPTWSLATITQSGTLSVPQGQQILIPNGTASNPAVAFSGSGMTSAGIYVSGSSSWSAAVGGAQALNFLLSSGGFGNLGMGGSASTSDLFPMLAQRQQNGSIIAFQLSNPAGTAGSGAKWQSVVDSGNNTLEILALSTATVSPAAYGPGRGVVRATGGLSGLSLIADAGSSLVDVFAGGNTEPNRIARFNPDGSFQLIQAVSTPSVRAGSSGIKVYAKTDGLYSMNSSGIEGQLLAIQSGIAARGDLIAFGSSGIFQRVSAGADGLVLSTDSTQRSGLVWTSVSSLGQLNVSSKTANYQMVTTDDVILVSSSAFAVTLPDLTIAVAKKVFRVAKTDTSLGAAVTVQGSGAQQIAGFGNSVSLWTQGEAWEFTTDGAQWQALAHKTNLPPTAYTPTFAGMTPLQNLWYGREGAFVIVGGTFTSASSAASEMRLPLPGPVAADTNIKSLTVVGQLNVGVAAGTAYNANIEASSTYLVFTSQSAGFGKLNGNFQVNSTLYTVSARIPVSGWQA